MIRRLAKENQDWGAAKIHGELLKLGFVVSERTVARYLRRIRRRGDPAKSWLTFLQNHREVITAFDFFTVPTVTFQLLYCFFVIAAWTAQNSALQCDPPPYSGVGCPATARGLPRSWPVSVRRLGSRFDLRRRRGRVPEGDWAEAETDERAGALAEWNCGKMDWKLPARDPGPYRRAERTTSAPIDPRLRELHKDRIHDSLGKDTPNRRSIESRPAANANVISIPRLGGLHHRYAWRQAA